MSRHALRAGLLGGALALLAPAVVATADASAPQAHSAASRTVTLRDIAFNPSRVTISRGDRVVWAWRDGRVRHNVTSRSFPSSTTRSRGSYSVTFRRAGAFPYRCTLHPGMNGSVVVRR